MTCYRHTSVVRVRPSSARPLRARMLRIAHRCIARLAILRPIRMGLCLRASVTLSAALVGACTLLPRPVTSDPALLLLMQQQRMLHAPSEEVATAIGNARANVLTAPTLSNRVTLALLLALPGSSTDQRREARNLLKTCDSTVADDPVAALCVLTGGLLTDELAAQQKLHALEDDAKDAEQHALDLQRELGALYAQSTAKLESDAQKRMRGLERQLSEQRAQLDAMRQQLQELQAIERSIETRREAPAETARTP